MKNYAISLLQNEQATKRWLTRLKRASNKLDSLRRQRVNILRAQSKALSKEADVTEKVNLAAIEPEKKPAKRTKPERRINL